MTIDALQKAWDILFTQWERAHREARDARGAVTRAFMDNSAGVGAGPTTDQMDEADRLEGIADKLNDELKSIIKKVRAAQ